MHLTLVLIYLCHCSLFTLAKRMEVVQKAKASLRTELKKKLSQMTAHEITEQSKVITKKVNVCL